MYSVVALLYSAISHSAHSPHPPRIPSVHCMYLHIKIKTERQYEKDNMEVIWGAFVKSEIKAPQGVQVGEDAQDAFSCRIFPAKEPLIIGLFCRKWPINIRHYMGLHHTVLDPLTWSCWALVTYVGCTEAP